MPRTGQRREAGGHQVILAQLVRRGVRRGVNLLRSHLSATFQYAAKADHDPTQLAQNGAIFEIVANPVTLVPRKAEFEGVGERNLSPVELQRFWHHLDQVDYPVVRSFLRFDLTLGGNAASSSFDRAGLPMTSRQTPCS